MIGSAQAEACAYGYRLENTALNLVPCALNPAPGRVGGPVIPSEGPRGPMRDLGGGG
jgi:hypothetical protein